MDAFPTTYVWKEIASRGWGDRLQVIGVFVSDSYAHTQLIRERRREEGDDALYADPGNGLAEAFGVPPDRDGMAGVTEARSAVCVLGGAHTGRFARAAMEWPEFPDYDAVEAAIDELLAGG